MTFKRPPQSEVDAARTAAILARSPLIPKCTCHYCGWDVPRGALWCEYSCAQEYEAEAKTLTGKE